MMVVRFSKMWLCIGIWLLLDAAMYEFGSRLPTWLQLDAVDSFHHDLWVAAFIAFMWIAYRERAPLPPAERPGGA